MKYLLFVLFLVFFVSLNAQDQRNLQDRLEASNVRLNKSEKTMTTSLEISSSSYNWSLPDVNKDHKLAVYGANFFPQDLTFFIADDYSIALLWSVENESNISHYEVQRYAEDIGYEVLQIRGAAGNSSEQLLYKSFDEQPLRGIISYRVVQVLSSGEKKISGSRSINFDKPMDDILFVSDVEGSSDAVYVISKREPVSIFIVDEKGQQMGEYLVQKRMRIETKHWSPGIYRYDILGKKETGHGLILVAE